MSNFTKAIHPDEEQEQHSLSHKGRVSMGSQNQFYLQRSSSKKQNELLNKLCVAILIVLLLISVGIFTYRYFELVQAEKQNKFNKGEIQTNMQSGEYSQHDEGLKFQLKQKHSYSDGNTLKVTKYDDELQSSVKSHKSTDKVSQQHVVQELSQINQNSMQYKVSQGIQTQQQQILGEGSMGSSGDEDSQNSHIEEQQPQTQTGLDSELNNVGSIEEAQLLDQKNAYNEAEIKLKQLNNIKAQLKLHQKVKEHYMQLFADSEQENRQEEKSQTTSLNNEEVNNNEGQNQNPQSNSKQVNEDSQKQSQSKMQQTQSQPNQQSPQEQENGNQPQEQSQTQQQVQQPPPTPKISSQHITDKDLYDPIVRVKGQIQKNLKSNFDDLYYIKAGTNITEQQYKSAIERMHLWKFYNPLTKNLQILDHKDVSYQGLDVSTPQSASAVLEKMQRLKLQQKLEYEQKYQVSQYGEIPFCIIIPSYKNQDKYFRNLNSILQQDYENYHIVYIDDASKDGTAQKVKSYIDKYQIPESRLLFIQNKVNKKALPNIDYAARRLCNSGEIMAIIDGDDYLIGTQSFKIINAQYQKKNLLVLYTNHLRIHEPIYLKVGTCIDYPQKVKKSRSFRRFSIFPASHLRTFFVDLYWRISIRDLKDYQGGYFTAANDFAIMMPILEMAGDRYEYFSELTYVYDAGTGFNNFQTKADKQARNFKITKRRHKYPKLQHDLEFEKNLRAKGLLKPRPESNIQKRAPPTSANRLRRNVRKI